MTGPLALLEDVQSYGTHTPEYWKKMMHRLPQAKVVDRIAFILLLCKGRVVLDVGCTGALHDGIAEVAKEIYGIDVVDCPDVKNFFKVDIDKAAHLPEIRGVELLVCGEVLEHLSNAGHFLELIHEYNCPVVITVPNAFADAGQRNIRRGWENVNQEHVAWYSYKTLKTLVERFGFAVTQFCWYNGKPGRKSVV